MGSSNETPEVAATTPRVSVVIVGWNSRDDILACLRSLSENPPSCAWEAIVVDNASGDGTVEAVRRQFPRARVIANQTNRGLAPANNQGIAASSGGSVVISNPDIIYLPGAIDALIETLERKPRAGLVFARLLNPDRTVQTCTGALPTLRRALIGREREAADIDGDPPFPSVWWEGWAHDEEIQIGHGGEACYMVRRETIAAIGPQDERYFLDWEGIEWCARAKDEGWEVWFCPAATVIHAGSVTLRKAPFRWVVFSHMGMYRYFAGRSSWVARPLLAIVIAARAGLKLLAVAVGSGFHNKYLRR